MQFSVGRQGTARNVPGAFGMKNFTEAMNKNIEKLDVKTFCQLVWALVSCVGFVPSVHVIHLVVFVTAHSVLFFFQSLFCALWQFYLQGP